jgi:hypothetical protein
MNKSTQIHKKLVVFVTMFLMNCGGCLECKNEKDGEYSKYFKHLHDVDKSMHPNELESNLRDKANKETPNFKMTTPEKKIKRNPQPEIFTFGKIEDQGDKEPEIFTFGRIKDEIESTLPFLYKELSSNVNLISKESEKFIYEVTDTNSSPVVIKKLMNVKKIVSDVEKRFNKLGLFEKFDGWTKNCESLVIEHYSKVIKDRITKNLTKNPFIEEEKLKENCSSFALIVDFIKDDVLVLEKKNR